MPELRYRVSVWKGEKVPMSEGGTLASRGFASLDEAGKWLERCDGECEVLDLSQGEQVRLFSGEVARVSQAIRDQMSKRSRGAEEQRVQAQREKVDTTMRHDEPIIGPLMMRCRDCGKEIARKAFLCPHCGAGRGVFRHLIILITVLIWLWVLVVLFTAGIWLTLLAAMSKASSRH